MLKMTTYQCILSTTVTKRLLSPSTVMSKTWNLLMNSYYLHAFSKVTFCPTNVNACITSFRKTLVSSDPVLLILPVLPLSNTILILAMLNPSNRVYCTSHHYFKEIQKQVKEMLQNGIIKPSVGSVLSCTS